MTAIRPPPAYVLEPRRLEWKTYPDDSGALGAQMLSFDIYIYMYIYIYIYTYIYAFLTNCDSSIGKFSSRAATALGGVGDAVCKVFR